MLQSKKEVFLDCIIRQSDKRQYGKKPCLAPPYCILYVTRDVCVMWNIVSRNGKEKKRLSDRARNPQLPAGAAEGDALFSYT